MDASSCCTHHCSSTLNLSAASVPSSTADVFVGTPGLPGGFFLLCCCLRGGMAVSGVGAWVVPRPGGAVPGCLWPCGGGALLSLQHISEPEIPGKVQRVTDSLRGVSRCALIFFYNALGAVLCQETIIIKCCVSPGRRRAPPRVFVDASGRRPPPRPRRLFVKSPGPRPRLPLHRYAVLCI